MAIVVALAAGCAGCGADTAAPVDPDPSSTLDTTPVATDPPATSAPTTTTSTTPVSGDEAEVRATIDRYWDAWFAATANPPDPNNAELNAVLIGDALLRITGGIQRWRDSGEFVRIPEGSLFERRIVSIDFNEAGIATVRECVVDDSELVSALTGGVVDSELETLKLVTTLRRYEDGWKITTSNTEETISGTAACDAT